MAFAAVMAKRQHPDRIVIAFAGDGCFLMNGVAEFAIAVQYDIPLVIVLIDNGMYGTIRMHQENHYPARVSATDLKNPDFRGARAGLWRTWRTGGDDGAVRACLRARAGVG